MNAPTLLGELHRRGAVLSLTGERLRIEPARVLDDELRAEIRVLKSELVRLLSTRNGVESEYKRTKIQAEKTQALAFAQKVRALLRDLPPHMKKASEAEKLEYATAAACLECGVEPDALVRAESKRQQLVEANATNEIEKAVMVDAR